MTTPTAVAAAAAVATTVSAALTKSASSPPPPPALSRLLLKDRSGFHWHGMTISPSHTTQHELSLLLFRRGYRWFPLLTSEWRGGQHELDPMGLRQGGVESARQKVQQRLRRLHSSSSSSSSASSSEPTTTSSSADLEKEEIEPRKDIRHFSGFQPLVQTTRYFPEDAVEALASKWMNPLLLWQLNSAAAAAAAAANTNPYPAGSFTHAYFGVMQYYREFLTLMFQRPTFVLSSVISGRVGQYDASFVANYIRHMVEAEVLVHTIFREVRSALTQSDVVRTVQHKDRVQQYTIRGIRVRVIGRTHDTIAYDRLKAHRMSWPDEFIPTKQLVKYVEFAQASALSKSGVVGIKVWMYLDQPA